MGLAKKFDKIYTYSDYINFPNDKKYEIIDGVPYMMSPSPSVKHQRILRKLMVQIDNYLNGTNCEVFASPLDVILTEDEDFQNAINIVQPDVFVICNKSIIREKNIIGSPDFIIEIVSTSSQSLDYVKKLYLYENYKIKEYWIVNPLNNTIIQYIYEENSYSAPNIYRIDDIIECKLYPTIKFNINELFD